MSNKKNSVESSILQSKYSKPEPHYKVFSSYKPVLLFHDLVILLLSFVLTRFLVGPSFQDQNLGILILITVMSISVFIFILWVFNLYSYGANFIWNHHFARMKKALGWVLVSFGIFTLLIYWNNLYSDKIVSPLLTGILLFLLVFLNPFKFVTYLTYALAICLIIIGAFGLVVSDGLAVLKQYSSLLPIFYIVSTGLLLGGRYALVHIVFEGWMRKIFRWGMVVIGSGEEAKNIANYMIKNDAPFYVKGFITSDADGDLDCTVTKRCIGEVNDLSEIAASTKINDIVITDANINKDLLLRILDYCIGQRLNVWFTPKLLPIITIKIQLDYMSGLPMIRLCNQKRDWLFNKIKHGLDALFTLPIFILQLPVFKDIRVAS